MGPPGAGKSTQAGLVADHFKIPAISTDDIFRANISRAPGWDSRPSAS